MKQKKIEWELYNVSEDYPRVKNKKALVAFVDIESREEFNEAFPYFTRWKNENGVKIHRDTAATKFPAILVNTKPRSQYKDIIFITDEEFDKNFFEIEIKGI